MKVAQPLINTHKFQKHIYIVTYWNYGADHLLVDLERILNQFQTKMKRYLPSDDLGSPVNPLLPEPILESVFQILLN